MYIAMNRFTVRDKNTEAFEALWLGRESHLKGLDGFLEFHMLKGPKSEEDGTVLYSSHTTWESYEHFVAWIKSEAFRAAHKNTGQGHKLHEGRPNFEGFHSIQKIA